jgi:hypothetical protein
MFGAGAKKPCAEAALLMQAKTIAASNRRFMFGAFWTSGPDVNSYDLVNTKPWLLYWGAPGTRPWAWWNLEDHPPRAAGESQAEYLTRHDLWLPGERELFEARNAEAKIVKLRPKGTSRQQQHGECARE